MSSTPSIKAPGTLWYAWQNTKVFAKSFFEYEARPYALGGAKNLGIGLGALAVGQYIAVPLVAAIPLMPTIVSIAACWTAIHFALKSYRDFKQVKNSGFAYSYIKERERERFARKSRPSFLKRAFSRAEKPAKAQKPVAPQNRTVNGRPISEGVVFEFPAAPTPPQPPASANNNSNAPAPKKRPGGPTP